MTVEEEEVMDQENDNNDKTNSKENPEEASTKQVYVRSKMEAMQKRIDELKEKVKYEGELLHKEVSLVGDDFDNNSKVPYDSKGLNLETFKSNAQVNDSDSEKSLYFSASSFSLCTVSSSSSLESAYQNFTKFVNNFMKNQNQKERLSLLQLHSSKQISMNMMKHSLTELETRCSEELELVERSLQHLDKLAEEFNVKFPEDSKAKALEQYKPGDAETWKPMAKVSTTFIWPPLKDPDSSKVSVDWTRNPAFVKKEERGDFDLTNETNDLI